MLAKIQKRITEKFVERAIKKYIKRYSFTIDTLGDREPYEHGVDIKVKHEGYGQYYLVECKGDPGARGPVKAIGGSISSSINSAVGQIISRMHSEMRARHGGNRYGIAFPITFKEKILKRIPHRVLRLLHLKIFFVNYNGHVEEFDHVKLKKKENLKK